MELQGAAMFGPNLNGMRIITISDLDIDMNPISSGTDLDDIDDDIDIVVKENTNSEVPNTFGLPSIPLPHSDFNIRTLTQ